MSLFISGTLKPIVFYTNICCFQLFLCHAFSQPIRVSLSFPVTLETIVSIPFPFRALGVHLNTINITIDFWDSENCEFNTNLKSIFGFYFSLPLSQWGPELKWHWESLFILMTSRTMDLTLILVIFNYFYMSSLPISRDVLKW